MQILLAGYNVDTDVLNDLQKNSSERNDVTPETLSAAYARISRDPRPIDELRKIAREEVDKARKSNSAIIFKMGHHSVAEHAVFNFDLIGVSRFAVEAIEHFRLCSFTEKSQRYITLDRDYVIPEEIKGSALETDFIKTIDLQNEMYHKLNEKLQPHVFGKFSELAKDPKNNSLLEGWAKEDARYITSLATQAQLGLTVNARNLELLFRRFASQDLIEVKEISKKMFSLVNKIAPSIILFTENNDYDSKTYANVKSKILSTKLQTNSKSQFQNKKEVELIDFTKNADDVLVASLIFSSGRKTLSECMEIAKNMSPEQKKELIKETGRYMQLYDTTLREFENIDLTYDIALSASCFAQLKRHRMATIICQPYDISLGSTIPDSIEEIGMKKDFIEVLKRTEDVYSKLEKFNENIAPYILTNAHRRRVIFKCNARELYHVSRLREDEHAQWDIKEISAKMSAEATKVMPLAMMFIGGKHEFDKIKSSALL